MCSNRLWGIIAESFRGCYDRDGNNIVCGGGGGGGRGDEDLKVLHRTLLGEALVGWSSTGP